MRKKLLIVILILLPFHVFSQTFERTYSYRNATSMIQESDSSFVVSIDSPDGGLLRLSPAGNTILYKPLTFCSIQKIIKSNAGGYLTTGMYTLGFGNASCILRLDNNFDTLWMKKFTSVFNGSMGTEIIELPDSSIMLAISVNGGMSSRELELRHLDKDGNDLWHTSPSFSNINLYNIAIKDTLVYTALNNELEYLQLNCYNINNGDSVWQKNFYPYSMGNHTYKYFSYSLLASDSSLYIAGHVQDDTISIRINKQMILKTDLNGDSISLNTYSGGGYTPGGFTKIISTTADRLYCTGTYDLVSGHPGNDSAVLFCADNNGNILWEKKYCLNLYVCSNDLISTSDSGFAFCGFSLDTTNFTYYTYVVKTDSVGNIAIVNSISVTENQLIKYYYNSEENSLKINIEEKDIGFLNASIYSMSGNLLVSKRLREKNNSVELNTLAPGGYIVVLKKNNATISQHKFLVY